MSPLSDPYGTNRFRTDSAVLFLLTRRVRFRTLDKLQSIACRYALMSRGRASEPRSDAWIDGNWRLTPSTCPPSPLQGLHGGVIASLVDTMGSLALASRGMYMTGVSIDMSQTCVPSFPFPRIFAP